MPWCAACDAYRAPSAVGDDGRCRACGGVVDPGNLRTATQPASAADEGLPPIPWHLKLLVGAFLVYMGMRSWQGVEWVLDKL